jgi:class 3 adenylate cyclase
VLCVTLLLISLDNTILNVAIPSIVRSLHARSSQCEVRGDDLGGLAVHIAARIGALAAPGEVLVSGTVNDLVAGSRIDFVDHGEHQLKGVPGTLKLYRAVS